MHKSILKERESHSLVFPVLYVSPAFSHGIQIFLRVELPSLQLGAKKTICAYLTNRGYDMGMGVVRASIYGGVAAL